ncbi:MAG: hypothetical protein HC851_01635 [Acaryochloris sp. RU_4_1]|nr:hypothetical protein [Acaryochloris sp. SU_5_25]NJM64448.1 hypothetical protein [Acaryochloris sp. RU_4_1]NJR54944.1 hypothetical protein [Acaryochloris sp. CRU_2_0]
MISISTKVPEQTLVSSDSFVPRADQWVQLRDCLSEYSSDTALLLCEEEAGQWVAWVPGFGSATLNRSQLLRAVSS